MIASSRRRSEGRFLSPFFIGAKPVVAHQQDIDIPIGIFRGSAAFRTFRLSPPPGIGQLRIVGFRSFRTGRIPAFVGERTGGGVFRSQTQRVA